MINKLKLTYLFTMWYVCQTFNYVFERRQQSGQNSKMFESRANCSWLQSQLTDKHVSF
jgi:hypothetical protein